MIYLRELQFRLIMTTMENYSYFIQNKALFGGYPSLDTLQQLIILGVNTIIDLTTEKDVVMRYKIPRNIKYISYPIEDNGVPHDMKDFSKFVITICNMITLTEDEKLYVHCKGGHGRSSLVVSSFLCYLYSMYPERALILTRQYHNKRKGLRNIWLKIPPMNRTQRCFVYRMFKCIYFNRSFRPLLTFGFSNLSPHPIYIKGLKKYENVEAFIKEYNQSSNKEEIESCLFLSHKNFSNKQELFEAVLYNVIKIKLKTYPEILENLLNTALRPLYDIKDLEIIANRRTNITGEILVKIRNEYYLSMN